MIEFDEEQSLLTIYCDKCGEDETLKGDWTECLRIAKQRGWTIVKVIVSYEHYCLNCKSWD